MHTTSNRDQTSPAAASAKLKRPLRFYATAHFDKTFGMEALRFGALVADFFERKPMDLYVFDNAPGERIQVSVNGYDFSRANAPEESFDLTLIDGGPIEKFWCKIDKQENHYAATFLFPNEY